LSFLFVGRDNNTYWGIIDTPLIAVSITFVPSALDALWHAARRASPGQPMTAR
jgi:hypothetical protein